jgi:hypothetical protein
LFNCELFLQCLNFICHVIIFFSFQQLLEILWELAHLQLLKTSLVELALDEHLAILSDPFSIKDQIKKQYAVKCVEDIREVSVLLVVYLEQKT